MFSISIRATLEHDFDLHIRYHWSRSMDSGKRSIEIYNLSPLSPVPHSLIPRKTRQDRGHGCHLFHGKIDRGVFGDGVIELR